MNEKITFTDDEKSKLFDPLYDYSDEKANKYYKELNGLKKFFAYMSTADKFSPEEKYELFIDGKKESEAVEMKCQEDGGMIIDPDSESDLIQKVYKVLWDKKMLKKFCFGKNRYQGETLNSANTTFDKYYESIEKEEHEKERREMKTDKGNEQKVSVKYILSRFYSPREESREDFSNTLLNEFVSLYHTLGNFMPVPWDCNRPRGSAEVKDYWDLTMLNIYHYYHENCDDKDKYIHRIIGAEKEKSIERYKDWLEDFGDWENFVNKNYLRAFVDGTLYPKELWKGHFSGQVLPEGEEQCKEYFKNAAECIKERTAHLLEALQGVL